MRNINLILFLVVFICINLVCKDIGGYYCYPFCENGYNLELKDSNQFEIKFKTGNNFHRGKGTYILNDSILTLNFEIDDTLKTDYSIEDISCNCKDSHNLYFEFYDKTTLTPIRLSTFQISYQVNIIKPNIQTKSNNDSNYSKLDIKNANLDFGYRNILIDNLNSDNVKIRILDSLFDINLNIINNFFYHNCKIQLGNKNCKKIKLNLADCKNVLTSWLHTKQIVFRYEFPKEVIPLSEYKKVYIPGSYNYVKNVRMYEISSKSYLDE